MDWKLFLDNARKGFSEFNNVSPETFEGFSKMGKPVKRNGELTEKITVSVIVALIELFGGKIDNSLIAGFLIFRYLLENSVK